MARYDYTNLKTGETTVREYPMGRAPKTVCLKAGVFTRNAFHQGTHTQRSSCWPHKSEAMGCHPNQVNEMRSFVSEKKLPCHITDDGLVVTGCQTSYTATAEGLGYYHLNGGYSDPQKKRTHSTVDDGVIGF